MTRPWRWQEGILLWAVVVVVVEEEEKEQEEDLLFQEMVCGVLEVRWSQSW
jgi:hypothetical protein